MPVHSRDHKRPCRATLKKLATGDQPAKAEERVRFQSNAAGRGFSLLELLISTAVLMVIAGGVISAIGFFQRTYARTEVKSDMYENVRGVAELMEQEIGQAGLVSLPFGGATLSANVNPAILAQTVNVSSSTSMFVGEQILIDAGANNEELVPLAAVGADTIKAIFSKPHLKGAPVNALGTFANGIVPPNPPNATDPSSGTELDIFGDINGDGSLVYIRYTCNTAVVPGTLTRSVTTILPGLNTIGPSQTLLSTLIPNPGGTPCFQYTTSPLTAGYYFVTNVSITLSVRSTRPEPQTDTYPTMTKSFLYLAPRNVLAGYEQAQQGNGTRLQPNPANVGSY